jgi:hypothetical protein
MMFIMNFVKTDPETWLQSQTGKLSIECLFNIQAMHSRQIKSGFLLLNIYMLTDKGCRLSAINVLSPQGNKNHEDLRLSVPTLQIQI